MTRTRRRILGSLAMATLYACLPVAARAQVNLAAAREGARAIACSSSQSGDFGPANLIDGDPGTSWATAEGKTQKQWAIVRLAVGRAIEIGSVAIDNTTTHGHPLEAGVRSFELQASTTGRADGDFERVGLFSCRMGGGRQVFTFAPARATYVRLLPKGNYSYPKYVEVNEFEVFAATASPNQAAAAPAVLLLTTGPDAATGPFAPLAELIAALGASVSTLPGGKTFARLTDSTLLGVHVVLTSGEVRLAKDEIALLKRFVQRGGGLICALPADPSPLEALLGILGVSLAPGPPIAPQVAELRPHWITEELSPPHLTDPAPLTIRSDAVPLLQAEGATVALAGGLGKGRLVVLPLSLVTGSGPSGIQGPADSALALARRAVLWAAGVKAIPEPVAPPSPVKLDGKAMFLMGSPGPEAEPSFARLQEALSGHGLQLAAADTPAGAFSRQDLGDARLLIAFMPRLSFLVACDLANWVAGGGTLLVLGNPEASASQIMEVNRFLREFGVAIATAPANRLTVGIGRHPATAGINALGRPGGILGVWSFQGTTLAEMAGTPVATAIALGQGRLVVMDAGFAVDPVTPSPQQKKPLPSPGIQLQQNKQFVIQCVAWLLARP